MNLTNILNFLKIASILKILFYRKEEKELYVNLFPHRLGFLFLMIPMHACMHVSLGLFSGS